MQTYQVTCRCGHAYPYQTEFLGPDGSRERSGLLKVLEGLPCADCIRAAIDVLHTLREHLLKTGAVSPDITEEGWKSLARDARRDILRQNIIPPPPPRSPDISDEIMRYPMCPNIPSDLPEHPDTSLDINEVIKSSITEDFRNIFGEPWHPKVNYPKPEPEYPSPIPEDVLAILHGIDSWNRHHPVGTEVYVNPTDVDQPYDPCTHLTTSPAKLLAGKPVVEVSGLGPIHMERLNPFVHRVHTPGE